MPFWLESSVRVTCPATGELILSAASAVSSCVCAWLMWVGGYGWLCAWVLVAVCGWVWMGVSGCVGGFGWVWVAVWVWMCGWVWMGGWVCGWVWMGDCVGEGGWVWVMGGWVGVGVGTSGKASGVETNITVGLFWSQGRAVPAAVNNWGGVGGGGE